MNRISISRLSTSRTLGLVTPTWIENSTGDFVAVFTAGLFETDQKATWDTGDWNGDLRFNSGDFVKAFIDGGFEVGPRPGRLTSVPEPSSVELLCVTLLGLLQIRRR